jgi:hypothetical protein
MEELKHRVGGNKILMNEVFKLDGIVFKETVLRSEFK